MKRWSFLLALLFLCAGAAAVAQDEEILEGFHYQRITPPVQPPQGEQVAVVELFWYGCPHCYQFEPYLKRWKEDLPENVQFERIPAVLNPQWEIHARAFYAAQQLGVLDRVHEAMFHAMQREKRRLSTPDALANFFAEQGVSRTDFENAFRSFTVQTKLNRARMLGRRYGATGVPSIVINGRFRTDGVMAGGYQRMIDVMNFLIEKEQQRS